MVLGGILTNFINFAIILIKIGKLQNHAFILNNIWLPLKQKVELCQDKKIKDLKVVKSKWLYQI